MEINKFPKALDESIKVLGLYNRNVGERINNTEPKKHMNGFSVKKNAIENKRQN
jgi:hypothetical protein